MCVTLLRLLDQCDLRVNCRHVKPSAVHTNTAFEKSLELHCVWLSDESPVLVRLTARRCVNEASTRAQCAPLCESPLLLPDVGLSKLARGAGDFAQLPDCFKMCGIVVCRVL
jgi:hypothetical protein